MSPAMLTTLSPKRKPTSRAPQLSGANKPVREGGRKKTPAAGDGKGSSGKNKNPGLSHDGSRPRRDAARDAKNPAL